MEHADLDVRLVSAEAARGEIEKREVVLAREVLDLVQDRRESPVDRLLGAREVVEELRELREEAIGVQD